MHLRAGAVVTLDVEKPAAGGRMLARHEGLVVLVEGAIPGERVSARIERTGKGLAYASVAEVLSASPDRRVPAGDVRCGGHVYAHIEYPRQLRLKGEIIQDAFGRIGRMPLAALPPVTGSPEHGYRMRAHLHAAGSRLGFFREGTHQLCDAAATAQLLPSTHAWIAATQETLRRLGLQGLAGIELAEDVTGHVRACHLDLQGGVDPEPFVALADGLTGLSARSIGSAEAITLAGTPVIADRIRVGGDDAAHFELRRDVRAFFQGNRFLLEPLARHVAARAAGRPVVDLYAGVGLFGLAVAASGTDAVTLVEADPVGGRNLRENAAPFGDRVRTALASVETFLSACGPLPNHTVIADPPRTGLAREALAGLLRARPARLVYVSCDVATLARDARVLHGEGYTLLEISGIDLFPNTAHVESVAVFE